MAVRFTLRETLEADPPISQTEAARRSGVSFATINRLCTNATARVALDVLDRLCTGLGFRLDQIIEYTPDKRKRGKR